MKNNITLLLLLCLFTLLTASKCKKDTYNPYSDNGLPPATQKGKNIFACRVNGKPWISDKGIYLLRGSVYSDTLFATGTIGDDNYFEGLTVRITGNLFQGSTYPTNNTISSLTLLTNKSCLGYLGSNVINSHSVNGSIQLTKLDSTNKIISGTFIGTIPVPNCDTLHISDGRFDIRYF